MRAAEQENDRAYNIVLRSGIASLQCLGCEVYGRWGRQSVKLVPLLARERTRGLHCRIRRGIALTLLRRWWGVLGVALQKAVAHMALRAEGADLCTTLLEPGLALADLPAH